MNVQWTCLTTLKLPLRWRTFIAFTQAMRAAISSSKFCFGLIWVVIFKSVRVENACLGKILNDMFVFFSIFHIYCFYKNACSWQEVLKSSNCSGVNSYELSEVAFLGPEDQRTPLQWDVVVTLLLGLNCCLHLLWHVVHPRQHHSHHQPCKIPGQMLLNYASTKTSSKCYKHLS